MEKSKCNAAIREDRKISYRADSPINMVSVIKVMLDIICTPKQCLWGTKLDVVADSSVASNYIFFSDGHGFCYIGRLLSTYSTPISMVGKTIFFCRVQS